MVEHAYKKTCDHNCPSHLQYLVSFYINPNIPHSKNSVPPMHSLVATSAHQRPQRFEKVTHDMLYNWTLYNHTFHCTMLYEDLLEIQQLIRDNNTNCSHEILFDTDVRVKGEYMEAHYDNYSNSSLYSQEYITSKILHVIDESPQAFKAPSKKGADRGTSFVMTKGACTQSPEQVFSNTIYCSLPECSPAVNDSMQWANTSGYPLCLAMLSVIGRLTSSSFDNPLPFDIKQPPNVSKELWQSYITQRCTTRLLMYRALLGEDCWNSVPTKEFKDLINSIASNLRQMNIPCELDLSSIGTAFKALIRFLPESIAIRWITNVKGHCDSLNCNVVNNTIGYLSKVCPFKLKSTPLKNAMLSDPDLVQEVPVKVGEDFVSCKLPFQYIMLALYSRKSIHDYALRMAKRETLRLSNNIDIGTRFVYEFLVYFNKSPIDYNLITRSKSTLLDILSAERKAHPMYWLVHESIDPMVRNICNPFIQ